MERYRKRNIETNQRELGITKNQTARTFECIMLASFPASVPFRERMSDDNFLSERMVIATTVWCGKKMIPKGELRISIILKFNPQNHGDWQDPCSSKLHQALLVRVHPTHQVLLWRKDQSRHAGIFRFVVSLLMSSPRP